MQFTRRLNISILILRKSSTNLWLILKLVKRGTCYSMRFDLINRQARLSRFIWFDFKLSNNSFIHPIDLDRLTCHAFYEASANLWVNIHIVNRAFCRRSWFHGDYKKLEDIYFKTKISQDILLSNWSQIRATNIAEKPVWKHWSLCLWWVSIYDWILRWDFYDFVFKVIMYGRIIFCIDEFWDNSRHNRGIRDKNNLASNTLTKNALTCPDEYVESGLLCDLDRR